MKAIIAQQRFDPIRDYTDANREFAIESYRREENEYAEQGWQDKSPSCIRVAIFDADTSPDLLSGITG